ncbi:MAG: DUF86 domain-containing protein [Anaerolineales bacterium]|nr:DUF86 domain-containing protein [Anaerolineales bacterium]
MSKDDWIYVGHMFDMSRKAVAALVGKSREAYDRDEILRMALTHFIQVIGEAARKVSPEYQKAHPQIPWHEIVGMRHRIVHDYMRVDEDLVWEVVNHDLPALVAALEKIVPAENG